MTDAGRSMARYLASSSMMELRMLNAKQELDQPISYKDAMYLNLISVTDRCTASRLAEMASVSKPTVTARINNLEAKGMVRRVRSEDDGRVSYIELGEKMSEAYRWEWEIMEGVVSGLEQRFGREALDRFTEMMDEASRLLSEFSPERR